LDLNPSKSDVIGCFGGAEKTRMTTQKWQRRMLNIFIFYF